MELRELTENQLDDHRGHIDLHGNEDVLRRNRIQILRGIVGELRVVAGDGRAAVHRIEGRERHLIIEIGEELMHRTFPRGPEHREHRELERRRDRCEVDVIREIRKPVEHVGELHQHPHTVVGAVVQPGDLLIYSRGKGWKRTADGSVVDAEVVFRQAIDQTVVLEHPLAVAALPEFDPYRKDVCAADSDVFVAGVEVHHLDRAGHMRHSE